MKNRLFAFLLLLVLPLPALAEDALEAAIQKKDWPALAARFSDDSHLQLASYFQECQGVGFSLLRPNNLMFFARFRDFAEIGEISL